MTILKYIAAALLITIIGGSIHLAVTDTHIPVTITEDKAQETINSKLPFAQQFQVKVPLMKPRQGSVLVNTAIIDFMEPKDVRINSNVFVEISDRTAMGDIDAQGRLIYKHGSFYLSNVKINSYVIHSFSLKDKDHATIKQGKRIIAAFSSALKEKVGEGFKSKENAISGFINSKKNEIIEKSKAKIIAKLESTPIYTLKADDYKQNLAKLAINEINATEDSMVITMSIGKLIKTVWLYVIAGIAALALTLLFFFGMIRGGGVDTASAISSFDI